MPAQPGGPVDRYLVERAISGDRDAYTELVRLTIDRSYALATLILRDPEWARDATQEAYVTAWRDLSSLRDPDRFDAWIRRIVVRACYRESARERRRRHVDIGELDLVGAVADSSVACRPARRAGTRVPPGSIRTSGRPSYSTTTSACPSPRSPRSMGVPVGTAKSRLHRATNAMRATLEADARASLTPGRRPA